jgi:hypothetical protein
MLALALSLAAGPYPAPGPHLALDAGNLSYEIQPAHIVEAFDGESCWFHPRGGAIPPTHSPGDAPTVVVTMQKWYVNVSDYFSGLSFLRSDDLGETWSEIVTPESLAWREEDEKTTVGVCDFTPGWHPQTETLLGMGHTVRYQDGKLMRDPRPRETAYSVFDATRNTWTDWQTIAMPDAPFFFNSGNGCGQWLVDDNGDLLVPIYFKAEGEKTYATTVMRCGFDGTTITYKSHSEPIRHDDPRGVYEPSLTRFQGRYYLTMRNDKRAYVASAGPDLKFEPKQPWVFDDGEEIGSHNTQAHWVTHRDALFLVYTRKDPSNEHIIRNRAPLFMSQVDTKNLRLIRSTEQIVVPERGAMLGNFGVVTVSPHETWITVGEGMHPSGNPKEHGATGRVWNSRIRWSRPNGLRLP